MPLSPMPRRRATGVAPATSSGGGCRAQRGATLIEFALVLVLGLLPLVLSILQTMALLVARNTVDLATFLAARQGAVSGAAAATMQSELARGLVPLYVRVTRGGQAPLDAVAQAYAAALRDVLSLDELTILAPRQAAAGAVAVWRAGARVVPNDSLEFRSRAAQDANVLTIEVTHCQPLVVPLVGPALAGLLALIDGDPVHRRCYALQRAPLVVRASLAMQSDLPLARLH